MTMYCHREKINLEVLHIISPLAYENIIIWNAVSLSVYMYVCPTSA
jgi:hypothetical protein